ncbi:MAG: GNAT family N-acetyltransferase [Candidatus Paceibacterota bacterium]|jgi:GNAT superfamily N-acetyltransferase
MTNKTALIKHLISEMIEAEYLTKNAEPISFDVKERSEDPQDQLDRGWIIQKIKAVVNSEEAGTIKISYIPGDRFLAEYPSILSYLEKAEGRSLVLPKWSDIAKGKRASDYFATLTPAEQLFVLKSLLGRPLSNEDLREIQTLPPATIKAEYKKMLKKIQEKYGKNFEQFKAFHVDKPFVDYITVKPSARRNRIGAALYQKAAEWLATKGLKLYASGIQSDEAKASWEWLKQNKGANIGTEPGPYGKTRTYLSYL